MKANQFRLRTLFVAIALVGVACASVVHFGPIPILVATIAMPVIVGWSCLYNLAPEATKYMTVWLVLGACLFSMGSTTILRSRDNARRMQFHQHLRQFGEERQGVGEYQRGSDSERWAKACQILESRRSTAP